MIDELFSPFLSTVWGRRLGLTLLLLLSLLILAALLQLIFTIRADMNFLNTFHASVNTPVASNEILNEINVIPEQHLFGDAEAEPEVLPITSLQLRLVGVIQTPSEHLSEVIISEAGRPGKVYHIGDSLAPGVKIHAITPDGVVIENATHLEKLLLDRHLLQFNGLPDPLLK